MGGGLEEKFDVLLSKGAGAVIPTILRSTNNRPGGWQAWNGDWHMEEVVP